MYAGFRDHDAADRFCREHDELRDFLARPLPSQSTSSHYLPAATASSETLELHSAFYKPHDQ
jgi:hypothetical protein